MKYTFHKKRRFKRRTFKKGGMLKKPEQKQNDTNNLPPVVLPPVVLNATKEFEELRRLAKESEQISLPPITDRTKNNTNNNDISHLAPNNGETGPAMEEYLPKTPPHNGTGRKGRTYKITNNSATGKYPPKPPPDNGRTQKKSKTSPVKEKSKSPEEKSKSSDEDYSSGDVRTRQERKSAIAKAVKVPVAYPVAYAAEVDPNISVKAAHFDDGTIMYEPSAPPFSVKEEQFGKPEPTMYEPSAPPLPQEQDMRDHVYDTLKQVFNFEDTQPRINRIIPYNYKDNFLASIRHSIKARSYVGLRYLIAITNDIEPLTDGRSYFDYLSIDTVITLYLNNFGKQYMIMESALPNDHFKNFNKFNESIKKILQNLCPRLNNINNIKAKELCIFYNIYTPSATPEELINFFNKRIIYKNSTCFIKYNEKYFHLSKYGTNIYEIILTTYYNSIQGTPYEKYLIVYNILYNQTTEIMRRLTIAAKDMHYYDKKLFSLKYPEYQNDQSDDFADESDFAVVYDSFMKEYGKEMGILNIKRCDRFDILKEILYLYETERKPEPTLKEDIPNTVCGICKKDQMTDRQEIANCACENNHCYHKDCLVTYYNVLYLNEDESFCIECKLPGGFLRGKKPLSYKTYGYEDEWNAYVKL